MEVCGNMLRAKLRGDKNVWCLLWEDESSFMRYSIMQKSLHVLGID